MVVSASAIASAVGRDVLAAGGNAIDAAIATGFALAVTYPTAGNIGGGGFMVIRFPDGRATTIDFREMAPAAATPDMFTDSTGAYSSRIHHNADAVGVPGTVAGFALAHSKYGKAKWARLSSPRYDWPVTASRCPRAWPRRWAAQSEASSVRIRPASPPTARVERRTPPARRMKLPDLARTLGRIRDKGKDGFYKGETARLVAAEMRAAAD